MRKIVKLLLLNCENDNRIGRFRILCQRNMCNLPYFFIYRTSMLLVPIPVFLSHCFLLCGYLPAVNSESVHLNSNVIKNLHGGLGNPKSDGLTFGSGSQKTQIDTVQTLNCANNEECAVDEYCNESRGACLPCRKHRKRCGRDLRCCPGTRCSNGVCSSNYYDTTRHVDVIAIRFLNQDNHTAEPHLQTRSPGRPQVYKGQSGENCLRSTDCSEGLCCARHFWSRICKPVLTDGQVCTRHKKKGAHGLEIFQRCNCGDGLICRAQGDHFSTSSRSLHTCQRV